MSTPGFFSDLPRHQWSVQGLLRAWSRLRTVFTRLLVNRCLSSRGRLAYDHGSITPRKFMRGGKPGGKHMCSGREDCCVERPRSRFWLPAFFYSRWQSCRCKPQPPSQASDHSSHVASIQAQSQRSDKLHQQGLESTGSLIDTPVRHNSLHAVRQRSSGDIVTAPFHALARRLSRKRGPEITLVSNTVPDQFPAELFRLLDFSRGPILIRRRSLPGHCIAGADRARP